MNLGDLRASVVAALEAVPEVASGEWIVHPAPVDALEPPAYVVQWGPDPWRIIESVCTDTANLETLVIAARLEPEANYGILELMVDGAIGALVDAALRPWQTLAPAPLEIANVTYLTARVQIRGSVNTEGN